MPAGEVIAKAVVEYEGRFDPASKKQMENELRTTAGELTKLFAGVFASAKFIQGMSGAIQAASNLNEEVNKTKVVFGDSGDEVIKFSTKAATAMGLSERAYLSAAGNLKGLLDNLGLTNQASTEWSQKLVQLGSDLASFFNKDP